MHDFRDSDNDDKKSVSCARAIEFTVVTAQTKFHLYSQVQVRQKPYAHAMSW